MTKGAKLTKNIFHSAIAQFGNLAISFIISVIVARILGAEGRGTVAAALLLPSIAIALTLNGLLAPITYFVASKEWGKNVIFQRIWTLVSWLVLASILVVFGLYLLKDSIISFVPAKLLLLALLMLPLFLIEQVFKSVLIGFTLYKEIKQVVLIQGSVQLMGVIVLWLTNSLSVYSALAVQLVGIALSAIGYGREIRKVNIPMLVPLSLKVEPVREAIRYGIKTHLSNIAQFFNYKSDQIIIASFLGPFSLGVYAVALSLSEKLWVVTRDIAGVLLPTVSGNKDDLDMENFTVFLGKTGFYATLFAAVVLSILVILFAEDVYGKTYVGLEVPFLILLPGIVAMSLGRVVANYLAGIGFPELNMKASMFSLLVNLATSLSLVWIMGVAGVALGTSIAHITATIYVLISFNKLSKCRFVDLILFSKNDMLIIKNAWVKMKSQTVKLWLSSRT